VLVWAFIGITARQLSRSSLVGWAAAVMALAIVIALILALRRRDRPHAAA
jgi:hypothetical protein